jgi:hypothetical protein
MTHLRGDLDQQSVALEAKSCLAHYSWKRRLIVEQLRNLRLDCVQAIEQSKQICAQSKTLTTLRVPHLCQPAARERSIPPGVQRYERAGERRVRELRQLAEEEGFPIVRIRKWQFRVGALCMWPAAGRWINEATGRRGKMALLSMRQLIAGEAPDTIPSATGEPPEQTAYESEPTGRNKRMQAPQSLLLLAAAVGHRQIDEPSQRQEPLVENSKREWQP